MLESIREQPEGVLYLRRVIDGEFRLPLLLVGEQGVGRRSSVVEAAKLVFADEDQAYQLSQGVHPDFRVIERDAEKDIKVEVIRDLIDEANVQPSRAMWKMFLIDGVDHLTVAAANALLKVLEEPPDAVRFFLLAERYDDVLPTIRSRCAMVRYRKLSEELLMSKIMHTVNEQAKALVYCRMAEGSLGRALRYSSSGRLMLRDKMIVLMDFALKKDLSALFPGVDDLDEDTLLGVKFLGQIVRDLVVLTCDARCRLINCDIVDRLANLRSRMRDQELAKLQSGLRALRRSAKAPINQSFHLKSVLAAAFI
jgi:DNA polymerase-3 subunit delta'